MGDDDPQTNPNFPGSLQHQSDITVCSVYSPLCDDHMYRYLCGNQCETSNIFQEKFSENLHLQR